MVTKFEPTTKIELPLSNCSECSLYKSGNHKPHNYWGNLDKPHALFIGEAPGKTEAETGKVFQGRAGKLLMKQLEHFKIRDFAIANTVCCRPTKVNEWNKIKDRKPSATESKLCKENLEAIINTVRPKFIVALGAVAMSKLGVPGRISANRGTIYETKYGKVFPMFHPAYVLRSPSYITEFNQDLEILAQILSGKEIKKKAIVKTDILTNLDDLYMLGELMTRVPRFAFDIETDGLQFYRNKIMGISFCRKEGEAFYVPLRNHGKTQEERTRFWEDIEEWCKVLDIIVEIMTCDAKKIAHNGKFDIINIEHHLACKVTNFWADTMLMHYLLDENKYHNLKDVSSTYFPETRGYDTELKKVLSQSQREEESYGNVPLEILGQYGGVDSEVTYRLCKVLGKELVAQPKLLKLFTHLYMPLSRVYADSEKLGVQIDKPYTKKLIKEYQVLKDTELNKVYGIAGHEFNLNSYPQVGKVLYEELKFPVKLKTDSGLPSTKEAALKLMPQNHKSYAIIKALLDYRGYTKMLNTYLEPAISRSDDYGRIHPSFLLHGTVSGRLSSKGPNIQNIPRDSKIKGMITAAKGFHLIEIDYNQAELRVMAYYSKDKEMTKQYMNNEDIHLATASTIFKKPPKDITKQERKYAKLTNFGGMYGGSPKRLMTSINEKLDVNDRKVTLREAEVFRAGFFKRYYGIEQYIDKIHGLIRKTAQVESIFGRIRRLPQIRSPHQDKQAEALREGLNALIQGTASDLTQLSLVKVYKALKKKKSRFLFTVHDAIILEIHETEMDLIPILKALMEEQLDPLDFPMIADAEHFPKRWGNDPIALG